MRIQSTWFYVSPQLAPIGRRKTFQLCRMEVAGRELTKKITLLDFYLKPDVNHLLRIVYLLKCHPRPFVAGNF
jgi:hypothetical protein